LKGLENDFEYDDTLGLAQVTAEGQELIVFILEHDQRQKVSYDVLF
jgi:hypothetical protein